MTIFLLGYPSEHCTRDALSFYDNYLGGSLVSFLRPEIFPLFVSCPLCGDPMSFILQMYCPVQAVPAHRQLFVFSCLAKHCQALGNCWRVFRQQGEKSSQLNLPESINFSNSDWDFGDDLQTSENNSWIHLEEQEKGEEIADTFQTLKNVEESSYKNDNLTSPFEPYFIEVYQEDSPEDRELFSDNRLENWILDHKGEEEFLNEDDEETDSSIPHLSAKYQLHLTTRSDHGCEAVRYSWCGRPIFTNLDIDDQLANKLICPACFGDRVFEFQLFSSLNNSLHLRNMHFNAQEINVNWPLNMLTAIVFTCSASCQRDEDSSWLEECIFVQTENGKSVIN